MGSANGPAERVHPAPHVDDAAQVIGEPGFNSSLVRHGLLLVLEGPIEEAKFRCSFWRHDSPPEMIAVTDGATLE